MSLFSYDLSAVLTTPFDYERSGIEAAKEGR